MMRRNGSTFTQSGIVETYTDKPGQYGRHEGARHGHTVRVTLETQRAMRFAEIQDALRKQPFEPFRVRLTTGDTDVVRHPELAALTRTSMFVGVPARQREGPDRMVQLDLLHIAVIEPVNGQRRRPRRRNEEK